MSRSLDLALNVAAADGRPLLVVRSGFDQSHVIQEKLVDISWSQSLAGQFVHASIQDEKELKPINAVDPKSGILVVQPGSFGLSGKVVAQYEPKVDQHQLQTRLTEVLASLLRPLKGHRSHVRRGIALGRDWESEIPETDPMSIRARQRARGG